MIYKEKFNFCNTDFCTELRKNSVPSHSVLLINFSVLICRKQETPGGMKRSQFMLPKKKL